jgi:hypothetical protein
VASKSWQVLATDPATSGLTNASSREAKAIGDLVEVWSALKTPVGESSQQGGLPSAPSAAESLAQGRPGSSFELLPWEVELSSARPIAKVLNELKSTPVDAVVIDRVSHEVALKMVLEGHAIEARQLLESSAKAQSASGSSADKSPPTPAGDAVLRDLQVIALGEGGSLETYVAREWALRGEGANASRGPPESVQPLLPEALAAGYRSPLAEPATAGLPPLEPALAQSAQKLQTRLANAIPQKKAAVEQQKSELASTIQTRSSSVPRHVPSVDDDDDDDEDEEEKRRKELEKLQRFSNSLFRPNP